MKNTAQNSTDTYNEKERKIFSYVKYSKAKELMIMLKRTVRWMKYLDQDIMKNYATWFVHRNFSEIEIDRNIPLEEHIQFMEKKKNIEKDMLDTKWEAYEDNWVLVWTLRGGGNTRDHTKMQYNIFKTYWAIDVQAWVITQEDFELLLITTAIHDMAEAIVSDIIGYEKKEHHKKLEYEVGLLLIKEITKNENQEVREKDIAYITRAYQISFIKDGVVKNFSQWDKELWKYFRTGELIWFLEDSITARKDPERIKDKEHIWEMVNYNAGYLIYSVLIRQIQEIITASESNPIYPSMITFLKTQEKEIDTLFDFVEKSPFMTMVDGKDNMAIQVKKSKLQEAKQLRENKLKYIYTHK